MARRAASIFTRAPLSVYGQARSKGWVQISEDFVGHAKELGLTLLFTQDELKVYKQRN